MGPTSSAVEAGPTGLGTAIASVSIEGRGAAGVSVVGEVLALSEITVRAQLKVTKRGLSGEVTTSQARDLEMEAGDRAAIARLDLSFAVGDTLSVTVVVSENETIVSTASVIAGSNR